MAYDKKAKVKKGMLTVRVGLKEEEEEKFVIPISYLHHPLFKKLLDSSREVYGYSSSGPLRLPCSVDDFIHVRWLVERESTSKQNRSDHHKVHHLHHLPSFSLHSC